MNTKNPECSFCGIPQKKAVVMVADDKNEHHICNDCVADAIAIVAKRLRELREKEKPILSIKKG